jgi:hypothetical protein
MASEEYRGRIDTSTANRFAAPLDFSSGGVAQEQGASRVNDSYSVTTTLSDFVRVPEVRQTNTAQGWPKKERIRRKHLHDSAPLKQTRVNP